MITPGRRKEEGERGRRRSLVGEGAGGFHFRGQFEGRALTKEEKRVCGYRF